MAQQFNLSTLTDQELDQHLVTRQLVVAGTRLERETCFVQSFGPSTPYPGHNVAPVQNVPVQGIHLLGSYHRR
jgi:hypothetical protein